MRILPRLTPRRRCSTFANWQKNSQAQFGSSSRRGPRLCGGSVKLLKLTGASVLRSLAIPS